MGKRSNFERKPRDFYPTPYSAVVPLIKHLDKKGSWFAEPCAGDGALIDHLVSFGLKNYWASDIKPMRDDINEADALILTLPIQRADCIITNPPWDRKILHPMIEHFSKHCNETWLLFDADWMHTKQAIPYLEYCEKIVSVGRVSWEGNGVSGKDNCCWYKFLKYKTRTEFIGR